MLMADRPTYITADHIRGLEERLDGKLSKVLVHLEGPPGEPEKGLISKVLLLSDAEKVRKADEAKRKSIITTLALTTVGALITAGVSAGIAFVKGATPPSIPPH